MVAPFSPELQSFSGVDSWQIARDGYKVFLSLDLHFGDSESVFFVLEGDSFDLSMDFFGLIHLLEACFLVRLRGDCILALSFFRKLLIFVANFHRFLWFYSILGKMNSIKLIWLALLVFGQISWKIPC